MQRFSGAHAAGCNLFNIARQLVSAEIYRYFRLRAFGAPLARLCVLGKGSGNLKMI